ncbi:ABC transporter permease subunit [Leucobacter insecticola]|uniref:ABC transporter permease subunit n=1 Tax=Leucobacter insecticola TaxID=2714934 RepID=A0A6G8FGN5_9MICO|nr:ABC transporter permease subunit [Leucobacter insecticola]QIM15192.1 ABC transporter permease subunit [Leucobacter insecticola]
MDCRPIACGLISAMVTFGIGTLVSAAAPSWTDFVAIIGFSLCLAIPITLIGLALGFVLSKKTALAVSLTVAFSMILLGGISGFPMPQWIEIVSSFLPSGAAGSLTANYLSGSTLNGSNFLVLAGWTVAGLISAVVLYRRDEGRKFR